MPEKIIEKSSEKMYLNDMVQYSIVINRRRAFPDVRDGLKPVQRKVIYDMFTLGAIGNRKLKSAKIVGDTMGAYHPHGDSSTYGAMVVLGNWFSSKIPLIDTQGNWGTVMGDGPAAMRYTEASLSDFCYDCIVSELKTSKYIVDWKDNFDRTTKEPEYLPAKVPYLLINGTFGIGVGMAVNIPPHNICEVIDATRKLIRDPNADIVLVPDHCQPLKIIDTDWKSISETGTGKYKVKGIIEIVEEKGYPVLYVKSLPDNVNTTMVKERLFALIEKKQLPMIKDVVDPSKETVNLKITLKKGTDPYYVKEVLYSKCGVQGTVSVNFEAVNDINPDRFSYKKYLLTFLEQRATIKFRLYCNKLKEASTRYHRLDAYIKIIESGEIDNIIKMIKKQDTIDDTQLTEYLIKKLNITDLQAGFILSTDIRRLSKGYLKKYKEEFANLTSDIEVYKKAVTDNNGEIIMNEIDQELAEISAKYGTPRICQVVKESDDNNIPKGIFKIVITEKNYIRKIPDTDKIGIVRGDNPKFIMRVDNAENLLLFDNKGKVFKLPIFKIPVTDRNGLGTDIRILSKNLTADIIAAYYEPNIKKVVEGQRKHYLVVVTKNNVIKKLDMEDFMNVNLSGLLYSKIRDDDEVVGIQVAPADLDVVIYSKQKALRTHLSEIPLFKRNAAGSKAMNTNEFIEGISVIYPDAESVLVVTEHGKLNKFPISGMLAHGRAKSGNNVIKLDSNDSIFSIFGVNEADTLRMVTSDGPIEIPVSEVKLKSAVAVGQKLVSVKGVIIRCDIIRI